jgi:diguanylate cyclase (GGDEF)-like protein
LDEVAQLRGRVDRLEELVTHDSLTGLYNLRHLQAVLPVVLERTRRSDRPASLIMLDIDHFKQINDTWGHEVGNLALKQTARILCQQVRLVDIVCRYGGEEFVVVLPDTGLRQAVQIAERIRRRIANRPVAHAGGEFRMTVSMGVEVHQPGEDHNPQAFIESADRLLYRAKESGRNRVSHRDFAEVATETGVSQDEKEALRGLFTED